MMSNAHAGASHVKRHDGSAHSSVPRWGARQSQLQLTGWHVVLHDAQLGGAGSHTVWQAGHDCVTSSVKSLSYGHSMRHRGSHTADTHEDTQSGAAHVGLQSGTQVGLSQLYMQTRSAAGRAYCSSGTGQGAVPF